MTEYTEEEPVCPYNLTPIARLSDREKHRLKERAKREAVLKAGSMVFDDLTGRTYFNKGMDDPNSTRRKEQYREQRRLSRARIDN
jgi:hypothetical protein